MKLSSSDFQSLREYIHKACGIAINNDKHYLVRQRLEPLLSDYGCEDFSSLCTVLKANDTTRIRTRIIEAITTNETSFFRDIHPFQTFKDKLLPKLADTVKARKNQTYTRRGPKVRIWCAAASTGQEPYSIAMLIHEYAAQMNNPEVSAEDFSIIATDISEDVLSVAMAGEYNELEIRRGLSADRVEKYFDTAGNKIVINRNIRSMVEFRQMNLVKPFTMLGEVDLIFCRNVLIYFDDNTKKKIFSQFDLMLPADGYLVLGSSENIYNMTDKFESVKLGNTIVYRKAGCVTV